MHYIIVELIKNNFWYKKFIKSDDLHHKLINFFFCALIFLINFFFGALNFFSLSKPQHDGNQWTSELLPLVFNI